MAKNTIELNEDLIYEIKKYFRKKGFKLTNEQAVNYSMQMAVNAIHTLDDETLSIIVPC
jgi:hypothetical protein